MDQMNAFLRYASAYSSSERELDRALNDLGDIRDQFRWTFVHPPDAQGQTPLHKAVKEGRMSIVAVLLLEGFDPACRDTQGKAPFELGNVRSELDNFAKEWVIQGNRLELVGAAQSQSYYLGALTHCPAKGSLWAHYACSRLHGSNRYHSDVASFPPNIQLLERAIGPAVVAARVARFFDLADQTAADVLQRTRHLLQQCLSKCFDGEAQHEFWDFMGSAGWARLQTGNLSKRDVRTTLAPLPRVEKLRKFATISYAISEAIMLFLYASHHETLSLRHCLLAAEHCVLLGSNSCQATIFAATPDDLKTFATTREGCPTRLTSIFDALYPVDDRNPVGVFMPRPRLPNDHPKAPKPGSSIVYDPNVARQLILEAERESKKQAAKKNVAKKANTPKAGGKQCSKASTKGKGKKETADKSSEEEASENQTDQSEEETSAFSATVSGQNAFAALAGPSTTHSKPQGNRNNAVTSETPFSQDQNKAEQLFNIEEEDTVVRQRHQKVKGKQPQKEQTSDAGSANGDIQESNGFRPSPSQARVLANVTGGTPSSPQPGPSGSVSNLVIPQHGTLSNLFLRDLMSKKKLDTATLMELLALCRDGFVNLKKLNANSPILDLLKAFRALPVGHQSTNTLGLMLEEPASCPFDPSHRMPRSTLLEHLQTVHAFTCAACQPSKNRFPETPVTVSGRLHCLSRKKAMLTDIRFAGCHPEEKAFLSQKLLFEGGRLLLETINNIKPAVHRDLVKVTLKQNNTKLVLEAEDDSSEVSSSKEREPDQPGVVPEDLMDWRQNEHFGQVSGVVNSTFRKTHFVCILDPNAQFINAELRERFLVFSPLDSKHNLLAVSLNAAANQEVSCISAQMSTRLVLTQYYYVVRVLSKNELTDKQESELIDRAHRQIRLAAYVKCFDDVVAINSSTTTQALNRMYQMSQQMILYDNDVLWTFDDFMANTKCVQEAQKMRDRFIQPSVLLQGRVDLRDLECFSIEENPYEELIDHVFSVQPSRTGGIRIGIHVSDVGAWVIRNGHLDQAAKERFCTLYFPNAGNTREFNPQTSMLPWLHGDCSLSPGYDRPVISMFVDVYEENGKPVVAFDKCNSFCQSVIRSNHHLTVTEVEKLLLTAPKTTGALSRVAADLRTARFSLEKRLHAMKVAAEILDLQLAACGGFRVFFDEFDRLPNPASLVSTSACRLKSTIVEAFEAYVGRHLLGSEQAVGSCIPFVVQDAPVTPEVMMWCQANNICFSLSPGMSEPTLAESLGKLKVSDPAKYVLLCKRISGAPKVSTLEVVEHNPARLMNFSQRSHYAYFCSPLHRYWDIIVHRLALESISSKTAVELGGADHSHKLCEFYDLLRRWEDTQNCQRSLDLSSMAFSLRRCPRWGAGIVAQIKETAMQLTHCDLPSMLTVPWSWMVGHCGTKFSYHQNGEVTAVNVICRCVDGYDSKLPFAEVKKEFTQDVVGRLEDDGVLSLIRKWEERRHVGQELRVLFSGQFIKGKFVVQTQLVGGAAADRCKKPVKIPLTESELAHFTCMCHSHPSASNIFFEQNDLGFPKLRLPLPRVFKDRKQFADSFMPLLQMELVQNSVLNDVDKNEENKAYWSQLIAIGRVVDETTLEFQYDKTTVKAFRSIRSFSLVCIRGLQNAMFHSIVVSTEVPHATEEERPVRVNLKDPMKELSLGSKVAVEFNVAIPVVEFVFSMMAKFQKDPNPQQPHLLERMLLDPSDLATEGNVYAGGDRKWANANSGSSALSAYGLNPEQKNALERAFKHRVSIIQGPPGTGKTKTAVSLAHLWATVDKHAVLYLGPSNQSVYVAAQALLKLPGVGTTSNPKRIQVTVSVRVGKVASEDFPGSWSYEAENHPGFKVAIAAAKEEAARVQQDVDDLKERAKKNPSADLNIDTAHAKLVACYYRIYKLREAARAKVLSETDIFLCTLSKWGILLLRSMPDAVKNLQPKLIIVDEAAQATEPETFLALAYGRRKSEASSGTYLETGTHMDHIVLVGDHMQLRPVVSNGMQSSQAKRPVLVRDLASGLDQSLFARMALNTAVSRSDAFTMLQTQYRMHQSICQWPSGMFYGNKLRTDESVINRPHPLPPGMFPILGPRAKFGVMACHVEGRESHSVFLEGAVNGLGLSYCNIEEANRVVQVTKFIDAFLMDPQSRYTPTNNIPTVAIITPYRAQLSLITNKLKGCSFQFLKDDRLPSVGTVSAYQGGEADFVICSWVRSSVYSNVVSDQSRIGFLCDTAQINVAMTRARYGLVLVGNFDLLPVFHAFRSFRTFVERCGTLVKTSKWPGNSAFKLLPEQRTFVAGLLAPNWRDVNLSAGLSPVRAVSASNVITYDNLDDRYVPPPTPTPPTLQGFVDAAAAARCSPSGFSKKPSSPSPSSPSFPPSQHRPQTSSPQSPQRPTPASNSLFAQMVRCKRRRVIKNLLFFC